MLIKLFKTSFLKLLVTSFGIILFTMPIVWLQISHPQQFHAITAILAHYPTLFTIFRWLLIVLLVGGWTQFIPHLARKNEWNVEKMQFWIAQRFRISTWLIVFELLVCENWLLTLMKVL